MEVLAKKTWLTNCSKRIPRVMLSRRTAIPSSNVKSSAIGLSHVFFYFLDVFLSEGHSVCFFS